MSRIPFLGLVFLCASAWAQQAQTPQQPATTPEQPAAQRSAAAGGSGLVTYDQAEARRIFRELDRNGDGYLSTEELGAEGGRQGNWAAVDRNGDGRITPDEFTALKP